MSRHSIIYLILLLVYFETNAQKQINSFITLKDSIRETARIVNTADDNILVSGKAMNLFIQKKVSTYLTGSSEISLSKLYATYTSESDKLTFGFNFPYKRKEDERLVSLFNPLIETDIKSNFATLYQEGQWQSNIRLGFKYSYFLSSFFGKLPATSINFHGLDNPKDQKSKMIRKRSEATQKILDKIDQEATTYNTPSTIILTEDQSSLQSKYETEKLKLASDQSSEAKERIKEIDAILSSLHSLTAKEPFDYRKKLKEFEDELIKAEVDALYEKDTYTWSQTSWFSLWGFLPLTERKNYIAENKTQLFKEQKFKPWEINIQFNYLVEGTLGILLFSPGYKVFQNNSALAELMTSVDYNQYISFPGIDTANVAILKTNKAFIGNYNEFVTTNFNIQLVLAFSDKKIKGGERFLTPGISIRFEKNYGDFSAINWRFGLPLRFKGKENDKPINIEPQVRLNNTNNYSEKTDYKIQPTFGINVGLPFTALFK